MKIYLIDDDSISRSTWLDCAESQGLSLQLLSSADIPPGNLQETGIVVIDRPDHDRGFAGKIQQFCIANRRQQVIVTGQRWSVDEVVELMRSGATIVYEKPLSALRLDASLPMIVKQAHKTLQDEAEYLHLDRLFGSLTERERQVLQLVLGGVHNRCSAEQLGVSVRTVEARRAKIYRKLECQHLAELVRKMERLDYLRTMFVAPASSAVESSSFGKHHLNRSIKNASVTESASMFAVANWAGNHPVNPT